MTDVAIDRLNVVPADLVGAPQMPIDGLFFGFKRCFCGSCPFQVRWMEHRPPQMGTTPIERVSVNDLKGLKLRATDGEIGNVDQFYFDETWTIRYLVVNAGSWLVGRMVLISPISLGKVDWSAGQLEVTLTKKQVENSPNIDTHKPVSRQHEAEFLGYYPRSTGADRHRSAIRAVKRLLVIAATWKQSVSQKLVQAGRAPPHRWFA
jgi:hypothetical protein